MEENLYYSEKGKIIFWIPKDYKEVDGSIDLISNIINKSKEASDLFECEIWKVNTFMTTNESGRFKNMRVFYATIEINPAKAVKRANGMGMIKFIYS